MTSTLHLDPELFVDSVKHTATVTGFSPRLIEKDYMCGVLLEYLASEHTELVFKGGTCLSKIHLDFYRLSEDLDFVIPMPTSANRKARSREAGPIKKIIANISHRLNGFKVPEELSARNESLQYLSRIEYRSIVDGREESIRLEIGLREPLADGAKDMDARMILRDARNPDHPLPAVRATCMSFEEAMAEKCRAALSRTDVAIRDFYDLAYAVGLGRLRLDSPTFMEKVRAKLSVPGNDAPDWSVQRLAALDQQMDSALRPVLREADFLKFNLSAAKGMLCDVGERLARGHA